MARDTHLSEDPEEDLLRPTLGIQDDDVGFQRPFNPMSLLLVVIFAKPLVGTLLLAWNAWRLGLKRQVLPLALSGAALTGALIAGLWWYGRSGGAPEDLGAIWSLYAFSGALVCLAVLSSHRRRHRIYQSGDGKPVSLWVVGVCAFVAGRILNRVVVVPWIVSALQQGPG